MNNHQGLPVFGSSDSLSEYAHAPNPTASNSPVDEPKSETFKFDQSEAEIRPENPAYLLSYSNAEQMPHHNGQTGQISHAVSSASSTHTSTSTSTHTHTHTQASPGLNDHLAQGVPHQVPESVVHNFPQASEPHQPHQPPQHIPEPLHEVINHPAQSIPQNIPHTVPQSIPETVPQNMPQRVPHVVPNNEFQDTQESSSKPTWVSANDGHQIGPHVENSQSSESSEEHSNGQLHPASAQHPEMNPTNFLPMPNERPAGPPAYPAHPQQQHPQNYIPNQQQTGAYPAVQQNPAQQKRGGFFSTLGKFIGKIF